MNNYKFRGKIIGQNVWAYGFFLEDRKITECKIRSYIRVKDNDDYFFHCEVLPETVGQWTGKTGMQNIELYSGDIIEYNGQDFPDAVGRRAVITYDKDLARFVAGLGKNGIGPNLWHECKKLGNIHDNPELMEGK